MFSDLTKNLSLVFGWTLREVFQTWHDYNLVQGLAVDTRFDDFNFISRSPVCDLISRSPVCDLISRSQVCKLFLDSCPL